MGGNHYKKEGLPSTQVKLNCPLLQYFDKAIYNSQHGMFLCPFKRKAKKYIKSKNRKW